MVKLALTGAAAVAVTEGFSLLQAWWAAPISRAVDLGGSVSVFSGSRFSPLTFATGGIRETINSSPRAIAGRSG